MSEDTGLEPALVRRMPSWVNVLFNQEASLLGTVVVTEGVKTTPHS